jgi:hypothetical protein
MTVDFQTAIMDRYQSFRAMVPEVGLYSPGVT